MGTIIEIEHLSPDQEAMISRLMIYYKKLKKAQEPRSVSKPLAEAILACKPNRRSMKLGQIFSTVLAQYPDGVIIKDIDVMFNPEYKVDVLKVLQETRKQKPYSVVWPGRFEDGKLIYSEEGYPDYKVFNIDNYDITCVI